MNDAHHINVRTNGSEHTPSPAPEFTPMHHQAPKKNMFGFIKASKKAVLWIIVGVIVLAAVAAAGFYYNRYHNSQKEVTKLKSNPQIVAQTEAQQLIDKVGRLTDLPKGETPTIATVTDITKLKGQAFFANAQNGDRVLIYTQAKKAILYRPSTDKVINIAPVNIGNNAQSSTQSTPTAQTPTGTTGR